MMRKLGMTAALVVALAVAGYAQKPDFSGTWTPDVDPAAAAAAPAGGGGGGMRGGGGPMTVTQSAAELKVERNMGGNAVATVYKLDGSEFEVPAGRGGTAKATAKWDGSKLVITTKTEQGESTQTWSLADGKLKIDRTGGRGPSSTTYKKTT
jgi:hypothetical protein